MKASVVLEGTHTPISEEIDILTEKSDYPMIADIKEWEELNTNTKFRQTEMIRNDKRLKKSTNQSLKDVEKQQAEFE